MKPKSKKSIINRTRRSSFLFFFIAIAISFFACQHSMQQIQENEESFSFVFMTDIHIQPENHATEGVLQAIDTINELNPDFVITGGDNVMDASAQTYGRAYSLYTLFTETMKSLNMPYYSTFGNHETYARYRKGLESNQYKEMYENRIGKRYYSFAHKNW